MNQPDPAFEKAKRQLDKSIYFFQVSLDRNTGQIMIISGIGEGLEADDKDNLVALTYRLHKVVMDEIENNADK